MVIRIKMFEWNGYQGLEWFKISQKFQQITMEINNHGDEGLGMMNQS